MVAGGACPMEWQSSAVQATNHDYRLRCISPEPLGAGNAHKLPGITGSNPCSKYLFEEPDRKISCSIKQV